MSSKRKSPPTKLEGGCQPTTVSNTNEVKTTCRDDTLNKYSDNEDLAIKDDNSDIGNESAHEIDNNDHNNNDDDNYDVANDVVRSNSFVNINEISINGK